MSRLSLAAHVSTLCSSVGVQSVAICIALAAIVTCPAQAQMTTGTTLSSNNNPAVIGQSVTFKASVTGQSGTPTGTVEFQNSGNTIATVALNGNGQASYTRTFPSAGARSITALYSGDSKNQPSTSSILSETVLASAANPIQTENALAGTPGWQLANPATNREIEGYDSLTSVNKGGTIDFFVSTTDPSFDIEIFRTGWYGGVGARLQQKLIGLPGMVQATPLPDPVTGLVECQWQSSYTLWVPFSWTTGIYLARLTGNASGKQSYIIFVVRDDSSTSDLVFNSSVTTFEAYNFWPGAPSGKSFYSWAPGGRAWKVSFNRPYTLGFSYVAGVDTEAASGLGAGEYLTNLDPGPDTPSDHYPISAAGWEYNMVRWLEKNGYDVSYTTNIDLHENSSFLANHKALLSVGHNEYWSYEMRQNVQAALGIGVGLAVFSANTLYWQIRLEPGYDSTPDRTIVCYKADAALHDPDYVTNPQLATVEWRNAPVNRPEAELLGVEYVGDPWYGDIIVADSSHWLFNWTGVQNGTHLAGLLGYEVDTKVLGISPSNLEVLTRSPVGPFRESDDVGLGCRTGCYSKMTWYTTGSASVFATGSIQWSWGLDDYNAPAMRPVLSNPAAQQLTTNVLSAMVNPLTITVPATLPKATALTQYQQMFSVLGGSGTLQWTASGLPSYLQMSTSGTLSGTPPAANTIAFLVTVSDAAQHTMSSTFTLQIAPASLRITTAALLNGIVGSLYSVALTASGGVAPYTWSATGVPQGLTLAATGTLSGTPTSPGNAIVAVTLSDSLKNTSTTNFALTINAAAGPSITTTALSSGSVRVAHSQTVVASGGTPPYTWSLASGNLPVGKPTIIGTIPAGYHWDDAKLRCVQNPAPPTLRLLCQPKRSNLPTCNVASMFSLVVE